MNDAPLPRVSRRGLADDAAELVRQAIFAGRFPPGAPLREVEIAQMLGISRGTVREGLALLTREGLLRTGWHRGTTVIDVTVADVEEVYAVRSALDRLAATTARRVATDADLTALQELVSAMDDEVAGAAEPVRLLALDVAFHDRIYQIAGNARLTTAWHAVRSQVHLFQAQRVASDYEHYRDRVVVEHRHIAELLREGELDRVAAYAEQHVDSARRSLLAGLNT